MQETRSLVVARGRKTNESGPEKWVGRGKERIMRSNGGRFSLWGGDDLALRMEVVLLMQKDKILAEVAWESGGAGQGGSSGLRETKREKYRTRNLIGQEQLREVVWKWVADDRFIRLRSSSEEPWKEGREGRAEPDECPARARDLRKLLSGCRLWKWFAVALKIYWTFLFDEESMNEVRAWSSKKLKLV